MAQQFQVLRCSFCHVFQVHQVKKSKKWNCKICDEKQSVLKVFGQGSGSDCRHHVQKLNLLLGEREQAPVNMLWHTEEPEERDNKKTVAQLEEQLDWQEEKVSRWNKYLGRCEEEEKILHTEKQSCCYLKNITEDPRKHMKTSLDSVDSQRTEENRVPGVGKNVPINIASTPLQNGILDIHHEGSFFSEHKRNSFSDTETCGNAANKSMGNSAVEELLVLGKNEETELRNAVRSNQKKSFSSEAFNRSLTNTMLEYEMPEAQNSAAPDKVQKDNEHIEAAGRLTKNSKDSSSFSSANLQKMVSKKSTSISPAFSSATGRYSSLFSTEDDFDDYL
ncbi:MRN complex-interacting protein isoform X3 [Sphaerodactylus townsendi]|uniref:MRN complex-interacting protein isoform X3 n=1 Tax=Sphaerodactylus townsendi TaxID=933632 RepID=UPI002026EA18|nr:MRN complex-interacting protein isoform X3 [Sphaerodactylus townsendi]